MAASAELIKSNRNGAEIYQGHALCVEKSHKLLEEFSLPKGLMPLDDITEMGFNRSTGFFWLNHEKKKVHKFKQIGETVVYDLQITATFEKGRITKMTGVKGKELLLTLTICDIFIDDPKSGKISFKIPAGLTKEYPVSAFELEDVKKNDENGKLEDVKKNGENGKLEDVKKNGENGKLEDVKKNGENGKK